MIQDPGPRQNLGFGIPIQRAAQGPNEPTVGTDSGQGAFARALSDKPILKFGVTAVATLVSLSVAGKVARSGGYRLGERAAELATKDNFLGKQLEAGFVHVRKAQAILDEFEGISRDVDPFNPNIFAKKDAAGNWVKESANHIDSAAHRAVARQFDENIPPWEFRDEIQQRLVKQARRLPYELPGFYLADKVINDKLLGNDQRRKPNWHNPIDVLGDFAWESTKNTAFAVLPFEAASASGSQAYRKLSAAFKSPGGPSGDNIGVMTTQAILEQLGVKSGDLIEKSIRLSNQSMGAFAQAVEAASNQRRNPTDIWRLHRDMRRAATRSSGSAARNFKNNNKQLRDAALDTFPGPFRGLRSGVTEFKQSFTEIGKTYDDYQQIMDGRQTWDSLRRSSWSRYDNVKEYMTKNGGSYLEEVADQMRRLGIGGVRTAADVTGRPRASGALLSEVKERHYKEILVEKLTKTTNLDVETAQQFVRSAARLTSPANKNDDIAEKLIERFHFSKNPSYASKTNLWWKEVQDQARELNVNGLEKVSLSDFTDSVKLADSQFFSKSRQLKIQNEASNWLEEITKNIIQPQVGGSIPLRKVGFDSLKKNLAYNDNFLVRNSARKMGIEGHDSLDLPSLRVLISKKGIDGGDNKRLLGHLVHNKVVKAPWQSTAEKNIFGFSSVSVQEALSSGYYGARGPDVENQVRSIAHARAQSVAGVSTSIDSPVAQAGLSSLKVPGLHRSASGRIIDTGRMKRGFRHTLDALANETKLPILNFNPLQAFFYNASMSVRGAAPIQFASKYSMQNVKQRGLADETELYMFLRSGGKSKGKLFSLHTSPLSQTASSAQLAGDFKPFLTNKLSMTGRYSELWLGKNEGKTLPGGGNKKTGRYSTPTSQASKNKWKRLFHVAPEQEGNLLLGKESLQARIRGAARGTSRSNTQSKRAARRFGGPGFNINDFDEHLAEGFGNIQTEQKGYGVLNLIRRPEMRGYIGDNPVRVDEALHILDQGSGTAIPSIIKMMEEDTKGVSKTVRQKIVNSQRPVKQLLSQADNQVGFWNLNAPTTIRTTGVSTRLDELKSIYSEYLILRQAAVETGASREFHIIAADMLGEVEKLHGKGILSASEKAEARTGILSLQIQNSRNEVYDSVGHGKLPFHVNKETLRHVLDTPPEAEVRKLFSEYGNYSTESKGVVRSRVSNAVKKRFSPADPIKPTTADAMGSPYTYMQTVGSAFRGRPLKTLKGLVGASWNDPEAITSGSIYSTHLATRINKYFETVGLGLDPTRYNSPIDFYTRGLVGRRIAPAFIAGSTAVAVDRTLGGIVYKDEAGDPIHRPLVLGGIARMAVEGQALTSGVVLGGQSYKEKKEELLNGEVPIRQGRFWLLNSNTPFKGGRIQYFRPSWYRRMMAGGDYTPEMNQSPMERLAFGQDFSPLRPLDPYRFERENYNSRPYPVSGDYFTGPWGPLNSALNQTVGRFLKPSLKMHQRETTASLASYAPIGGGGAASIESVSQTLGGINAGYSALAGSPGTSSTVPFYSGQGYSNPRGIASAATRGTSSSVAQMYSGITGPGQYPGVFSPLLANGLGGPGVSSIGTQVVPATAVQRTSQSNIRARRFGFETQEMAGIYGFGFGSTRQALGLGSQDFTPTSAVLEPASRGYSSSKSFWNLNLGGMGDLPLPVEGRYGNLEFSEIIRRFVPQEQQGIQFINGIPNKMGQQYPWLPGPGSMNNLQQGDPYLMPDSSIRLPGRGRDRVQRRAGGSRFGGDYSLVDIHDILGDVDPFGDNYRQADMMVDSYALSDFDRGKIAQTRAQREAVGIKNEFTPYKYKYGSALETASAVAQDPVVLGVNKFFENVAHRDTFLNSKFLRVRTAQEDWERSNIYGSTYPAWDSPYESFLKPMSNKATQRDPFTAASSMGAVGFLFGSSKRAKAMGSIMGGGVGLASSSYGAGYEAVTGNRFIPKQRKKELMLEEQVDILSYMHSMVNASRAMKSGDQQGAQFFINESTKTMYGANLNSTPEQLAQSIPKRKREHFEAMMYAPEQEREKILSTAPRLERRLLQAAWGQRVEKLPDIQEYFTERELPSSNSEFWSPYTDMEAVKIKMGQHMGLDMAQMGYYPQQIKQANLINPQYPGVFQSSSGKSIRSRLVDLLSDLGIRGSVEQRPTPFSNGDRFELMAGV